MIYNANDYRHTAALLSDVKTANPYSPYWMKHTLEEAYDMLMFTANSMSGECFRCHKPVSPEHKYCPWCRVKLKEDCDEP